MELAEIHNEFGQHLFYFIAKRVRAKEDAEDIYHEVLLKIYNRIGSLSSADSLKSWLFSITKNTVADFYRSKAILPASIADNLENENIPQDQENEENTNLESCIRPFIKLLAEEDQNIIIESEINGISQKVLAAQLNLNYTTLRSKVQRGRAKLKELLLNECKIELDARGGIIDCSPHRTNGCGNCVE